MKVMYPGSFDPITNGHIDLIERCATLYKEVIVTIMSNNQKGGLFTLDERLEMINATVSHLPNVRVVIGSGLTAEFAKSQECNVLVRGIRAVMDYEYELQHATANRVLNPNLETIFLVANPTLSYVSSSVAREIARYGGDLKGFVPQIVAEKLYDKIKPVSQ